MHGRVNRLTHLTISFKSFDNSISPINYQARPECGRSRVVASDVKRDNTSSSSSSFSSSSSSSSSSSIAQPPVTEGVPQNAASEEAFGKEKEEKEEEPNCEECIGEESEPFLSAGKRRRRKNRRKNHQKDSRQFRDVLVGEPGNPSSAEGEQETNPFLTKEPVRYATRNNKPLKPISREGKDHMYNPQLGMNAQTMLYATNRHAGIIIVHIDWTLMNSTSLLKKDLMPILTELFACEWTIKLFYGGTGLLDNLINAEKFAMTSVLDLQRVHNIIIDDKNRHAMPSLGVLLWKYEIPKERLIKIAEHHGSTNVSTFMKLQLWQLASYFRASRPSGEAASPNETETSNWQPRNSVNAAMRDRLTCDAWIIVVLFDKMLSHVDLSEGPHRIDDICLEYEAFQKSVTDPEEWELINPSEKSIGFIVGAHGHNIEKIRELSGAAVELYQSSSILITANDECQIAHAKKLIHFAVESRGDIMSRQRKQL